MKERIHLHRAYKRLAGAPRVPTTIFFLLVAVIDALIVIFYKPLLAGFAEQVSQLAALAGVPTTVPSVAGLSVEGATRQLEDAGFVVSYGGYVNSGYAEGLVAYSSPGGGAVVPSSSSITLYQSNGRPPKPPKTNNGGNNKNNGNGNGRGNGRGNGNNRNND